MPSSMRLENLDDGTRMEAAWNEALNSSVSYFRALLSSSGSSSWKLVSGPVSTVRDNKGAAGALGRIRASDVTVSRRNGKAGEVFRAVVDVDCGTDVNIDTFRACLATPETRPVWDRMVEEAQLIDLLDKQTRVTKTNFRLGWPSSPRDVVTISKTLVDQYTLIDVSTSVPRSRHDPAYLRPSPPYVRAQVSLMAWCVQLPGTRTDIPEGKARLTYFWSWNPKGTWAVGGTVPLHLPSVMVGLVDFVRDGSEKVPVLLEYGADVRIAGLSYDPTRVTLSASYTVTQDDDGKDGTRRQVEFGLSSSLGWDVRIDITGTSSDWSSFVGQSPPTYPGSPAPKRLVLRFVHSELQPGEELIRVKVEIERTVASSTGRVRINGTQVLVQPMESIVPLRNLLEGSPGSSTISLTTTEVTESRGSPNSSVNGHKARSAVAERTIASLIKRNYIYFTSLLQEPEPKWRPVAESKGVTVHQLNSIDKTLVVFRAEAVFVGVGIWDLFSTISTPGTRVVWDKTYEDATLLEDVNELTDVWHFKSKPSWPTAARDSVMVRTTYKSPSSVHIFGFSTENADVFPVIPPCIDPNTIRTQIDLQGWSIEALSPNTTQVTLLEQSHPGGWSNKSSIPQAMMSTLAGMGEFAIKHGAPPVATRLGGAKAVSSRYDVDKETYRFEYEPADQRRSGSSSTSTAFSPIASNPRTETIECGIRCDPDKWCSNIVVVVDPPPRSIAALKRHRLSPNGGGLWITVEHDMASIQDVVVTVRRGAPGTGGKPTLVVNGSKIKIDTEELSEADVQQLKKQKRSRPTRVALDQPPALALRKRQSNASLRGSPSDDQFKQPSNLLGRMYSPLARLYSTASESTRSLVPVASPAPAPTTGSTPVDAAIRALGQLSRIHADRDGESTDPFGWQPVSERDGLKVEKRTVSHVSDTFPVFRAGRIIEGFTAEEVSATVSAQRKDDYFEKPERLQTYGYGITTSHVVAHTTFPFRDRSAVVASVVARVPDSPPPSPSISSSHSSLSTIFHAASSMFDPLTLSLDAAKYNPTVMPACNFILEGWIFETIDPYSHEQYAIPSTRCMYVGAVDYGGNIPVSVNNMLNSGLPRALLQIETSLKTQGPPSRSRWPPMAILAPESTAQGPWALDGVETYKVPVDQIISPDEFVITVTVQPPTSRDDKLRPPLSHSESRSSMNSSRSLIVDLAEDIRRGRRDLIVAEIDVGTELVRGGCEVAIRAVSLPEAYHSNSDASVLPLDYPGDKLGMPFKCTVVSLAPSVLQTASLDPTLQTRHLLRVTLPTSGYEAPVNDPLTGKTAPLPRPRWLLDLINDGAAVQIRLLPRRTEPAGYMFQGAELVIEDERKMPRSKEPVKIKMPQLVNSSTANSKPLDKPLAVAKKYLPDPPAVVLPEPEPEEEEETTKTPTNEPAALPNDTKAETPIDMVPPLPPPTPRYNFWRLPALNRFSASAPVSNNPSPVKAALALPADGNKTPQAEPATPATEGIAITVAPRPAPTVPLPAVIILCLVCLLLGSLLRSILSEADFVIYSKTGTEPPQGEIWRELKRVVEWRIGFNRDLIIAFAHRRN